MILSREQLLTQIKELVKERFGNATKEQKEEEKKDDKKAIIGMVGYPNVGKSSVINVICGKKKVSVSAQPGKTKHFQTISVEEEGVALCDCPGLVFPSFTNSKAEMMCGGVISIDHGTDFDTPLILLVQRISRPVMEKVYNITLPKNDIYLSANIFLQILARERGYVTGSALPDVKKTAKMVLKDYVNGKLLYCHLRPDYDAAKHGVVEQSGVGDIMEKHPVQVDVSSTAKPAEAKKESTEKATVEPEIKEEIKMTLTTTATKAGDKMDQEFFTKFKPAAESKLNKDQRRQLKFAAKRGEVIHIIK